MPGLAFQRTTPVSGEDTKSEEGTMPDWMINIVSLDSGEGAFVVDGLEQGQPLAAQRDDLVHWYNQTNDDHQPWKTDANYNPCAASDLSELIPAGQPSNNWDCLPPQVVNDPCSPSIDPGNPNNPPDPPTWTIYYYCNRHPDNEQERGSINIAAIGS